jgi:dienelactone hydrolase
MRTVVREDIRFPSGGDDLAAWLYRPSEVDSDAGGPCVVLMHGFTATRDEQLDRFCERFAEAGIAALAFDFRHFGSSGGEPRQLLDLRRQYEDCDAAVAHARALEGVDASRVVIWGTSFAGGHALDAAARHPWLAGAICLVPLIDGALPPPGLKLRNAAWATVAGLRDAVRARRGRDPYLVPALGPPGSRSAIANASAWGVIPRLVPEHSRWRNEVAARILLQISRHRPVRRASRVRCPVLVQIVDHDTVVRNGPAERAARRAPRGELRRYEGMDHFDVYLPPGFDEVIEDQIAFLGAHGLRGS